jgi:predicted MFS family arabinose efflux permease
VAGARSSLLTRDFARLLATQACYGCAMSTFVLTPKFLAVELAARPEQIGGVMAVFSLANFLLVPLVGIALERLDRRVLVRGGTALMIGAALGFVWVESIGPGVYALRALQGLSFACVYISAQTLVADLAPRQRLSQALGLFGAMLQATNALVPLGAERASDRWGWSPVFGVAAGAAAVSFALALRLRGRPPQTSAAGVAPADLPPRHFLLRPVVMRTAVVMAMIGVGHAALITFIQPYALERGATHVGGFLTAYAACAMIARVLLGAWIDRSNRHGICSATALGYVVTLLAARGVTPGTLVPLGALLGLSHGLFLPAFNAMNLQQAGERDRSRIVALVSGSFNVGLAAGMYLLGLAAARWGYAVCFDVAAAGMLLALGLLLAFRGAARWSAATP